jgi:hypothetical protein
MTQLPLAPVEPTPARAPRAPLSPLAERVAAWAQEHDGATFLDLCDALPGHSASEVDAAAVEAGALGWRAGGYVVAMGREAAEGERR